MLKGDVQEVAHLKMPKTIPFLIPPDETFDVGVDTRTGVNDQDYKPPYPFNGAIHGVTFKLGPTQLTELEERTIKEAYAVAND